MNNCEQYLAQRYGVYFSQISEFKGKLQSARKIKDCLVFSTAAMKYVLHLQTDIVFVILKSSGYLQCESPRRVNTAGTISVQNRCNNRIDDWNSRSLLCNKRVKPEHISKRRKGCSRQRSGGTNERAIQTRRHSKRLKEMSEMPTPQCQRVL